MKIERIPTDTGSRYGEMDLELIGTTIRAEHRKWRRASDVDVMYLPVAQLGQLLVRSPEFRFEGLTFDEVCEGLDHARMNGWPR